jgi:hypothetical protein
VLIQSTSALSIFGTSIEAAGSADAFVCNKEKRSRSLI